MRIHSCSCTLIGILILLSSGIARAQDSMLARTPPMGWNSWNHFACEVSDAVVRAQADALVASGMKSVGYTYILIDDCWQGTRDAAGYIRPNARFPDMKVLAEYVHGKGLTIGIYSSPGPKTCGAAIGEVMVMKNRTLRPLLMDRQS
jgi:alpha-galactosidase